MYSGRLYNPTMAYKRHHAIVGHKSIVLSRSNTEPARSLTEGAFGHFLLRNGQRRYRRGIGGDFDMEDANLDKLEEFKSSGAKTYKADYTLYYREDEDGNIIADLIDIKGKELEADAKQQELAREIPAAICGTVQHDKAANRSVFIRSFSLVTAQGTHYFTFDNRGEDGFGVPASLYKCPKCGRIEVHPADQITCSACGYEFTDADSPIPNREALRAYTEIRTSNSSDAAMAAREAFAKNAKERGLIMFDANSDDSSCIMRIETPELDKQLELTPDFAYISQSHRNIPYGTTDEKLDAMRLQTGVFVFESLYDPIAKRYLDFLCRHAWDNETAYDAIVVVTAAKDFLISERHAGPHPQWRQAHWFTCEACGNTYIASHEFPECPWCNGEGISGEAEKCLFVEIDK